MYFSIYLSSSSSIDTRLYTSDCGYDEALRLFMAVNIGTFRCRLQGVGTTLAWTFSHPGPQPLLKAGPQPFKGMQITSIQLLIYTHIYSTTDMPNILCYYIPIHLQNRH